MCLHVCLRMCQHVLAKYMHTSWWCGSVLQVVVFVVFGDAGLQEYSNNRARREGTLG
jgi:hypothetical protein